MADFDANKQLLLFEEDVGLKINAVASMLQFEADETKEQNWQKFSKGKEELTTFVEIYTVLFGLIAVTLNAKRLSNKPSKNTIKALTIKLLPKLPKSDTNESHLTKSCFMTNLHDLLHEIHAETQELQLLSTNASADDQKQENEAIQAKKSDVVLEAAWNDSEMQIEVGDDVEPESSAPVPAAYTAGEAQPAAATTSIPKDPAVPSDEPPEGGNTGIIAFQAEEAIAWPPRRPGTFTLLKARVRRYRVFIAVAVVIAIAIIIYTASGSGETDESTGSVATQETCTITGWDTIDCTFDCDCTTYADDYDSQYVFGCDGYLTCYAYQYQYKASTSKCGDGTQLVQQSDDVDAAGCGQAPRDLDSSTECWVKDCGDSQFTFSEPADNGEEEEDSQSWWWVWAVVWVVVCFGPTLYRIVKRQCCG